MMSADSLSAKVSALHQLIGVAVRMHAQQIHALTHINPMRVQQHDIVN